MELFLEISSSKYIVKTSEYPVLDRGITNGTVTCDVILQTGKLTLGKTPWSSGKGEDSCPRGCEFESRPRCRNHLSCTINLDQKHES